MTTTLFRAAAAFDGHRHLGRTDVLVEDGRIVAVGGFDTLAGARGSTIVAAPFLSPGFTDGHVHPIQGGLERLRCDLSELGTREEYLAAIRQYADDTPAVDWILGGGWAMPAFPGGTPTAADLDAVVPGRPVFLPNRDHHGAWVSSRALEIAGIDRDTPDPPDGRIERDGDGHPTGTLHEGATALVSRFLPRTTGEDYYAGAAGRAGLPALARRHELAGRDRRVPTPAWTTPPRRTPRPPPTATCARTSSARCGGTAASASSRSRTWSAAARR